MLLLLLLLCLLALALAPGQVLGPAQGAQLAAAGLPVRRDLQLAPACAGTAAPPPPTLLQQHP